MIDIQKSIRIALIPIIGLTILEAIWNVIERIYILSLISPVLYLVKFSIYGYCGYIAYSKYRSDIVEGAITGAVAGFIFALIEGFIVSPLFTGTLFYHWGSEFIGAAISTIVTQVLYGILFSSLGVYITPRYLNQILRSLGIGHDEGEIKAKTKEGKHEHTSFTRTSDNTHIGKYSYEEDAELEFDFSQRKKVYKSLYGEDFDKELTDYIENKKNIIILKNYVFNYSVWSERERDFHGEVFSEEFRLGLENILNEKTSERWLREKVNYYAEKHDTLNGATEISDENNNI